MEHLDNFIFKWQNREVKVKILEDLPEIKMFTISIGPFKKGEETNIPYWIAKILKKDKIIDFLEEVEYDVEDLLKVKWKEQETPNIQIVGKEFYVKTKETILNLIDELKEEDKFSINSQKLQKKERIQSLLKDIFARRIYKILRIATQGHDQPKFLNSLTDEEALLYKHLRQIIKNWQNNFVEIDKKQT